VHEEFRNIGVFAEDDEGLRATRLNFEWVDKQRRADPDMQELLAWVREEKRRSEESRLEFRKALFGKSAEWIWHVVSAAIAGGVAYFFSTRGH
ncbi:MAG TPA: hypothetical protein VHX12_14645, partial [Acidisoma sp.]|nr:hypothetical protein [Acidisoma sp.]